MQVLGACPPPSGSASSCSQLDESSLIGSCGLTDSSRFRYFVLDKSVIIAMLEQPLSNQLTSPCLVMLLRAASGRRVWNLQLKQQLRGTKVVSVPKRPLAAQVHAGKQLPVAQPGPDVAKFPPVEADFSVPDLTKMAAQEVERLRAEVEKQQEVEQRSLLLKPPTRCRAPPAAQSFQTARMLLSHLGLLSLKALKGVGSSGPPGQLVALDSSLPGFHDDLVALDQLNCRSHDSASIFYMKDGQKTAAEVLSNMDDTSSLPPSFFHFLCSLGLPVEVRQAERETVARGDGGGKQQVFQFTDAVSEVHFILPHRSSSSQESTMEEGPSPEQPAGLQNQTPPPGCFAANGGNTAASCLPSLGFKVLIVWLENLDDLGSFPVSDFLPESRNNTLEQVSDRQVQMIFIHPLRTGLFRLCFHGDAVSRFSLGDGAIISRRTLGFMVRETVLNGCHWRRLDSDSAPSHVRRKQKISEMLQRYGIYQSEPSFYTALFQEP